MRSEYDPPHPCASSSAVEEGESGGELDQGREIGEQLAEKHARADTLPCGGEVARSQTEEAKEDGAGSIDIYTEIGNKAAVPHRSLAPVSGSGRGAGYS